MTTTIEPSAAGQPWRGAISAGTFRAVPDTITVTAPATGDMIGNVGRATIDDVDRAVEQAWAAQRDWAALPYGARVAVLLRARTARSAVAQ